MSQEAIRIDRAKKAYENEQFIHSDEGRTLRIISEYWHPTHVFNKHNVDGTIVFFGSARILSEDEFQLKMGNLNDNLVAADEADKEKIQLEIDNLKRRQPMTKIYADTVEMSERIARWSQEREPEKRYYIMTGGGPGAMEAANRGAYRAKAPSIGLNISLPFEQYPNQYMSPEFNFEFHYFFTRKYWFIDQAKAIIVVPGGMGTLDEMFEILTLVQTGKVQKKLPIVLYKEEFWKNLINFDYLMEQGMINAQDLDIFTYCNTPDEVFEYVTKKIIEAEEE